MATPKFLKAPNGPHVGEMLQRRIKERRIYKSALARHLNISPATLRDYFPRHSLQLNILWDISNALKHNFFLDIAAQLPPEFTNYLPPDTSKDERIAELDRQVLVLTEKLELLKEVMGKRG